MGDGHGAAVVEQKLGHRFANDIAAPDHDGIHPRQGAVVVAQHHQTAKRRAGHHGFLPRAQQTDVRDMKPVDILGRINRADHKVFVQMIGQGELYKDTVDRIILVQRVDQRQKLRL